MKALKKNIKNLEEHFDEIVENYTDYTHLVTEMFQLLQTIVEEKRGRFNIDWDFAVSFISGPELILWFPDTPDYPGGGLSYSFDGKYIKGLGFSNGIINYPGKQEPISEPLVKRDLTSDQMRRNTIKLNK